MTTRSHSRSSNSVHFDKEPALRLVAARVGDVDHVNHASGPDALMIGKRVRHLRKKCGLTLDSLGERAGLSASAVSLI